MSTSFAFVRLGFALVAIVILAFLATGLFDYFYIRYFVGQFEGGLADVDFANPHFGKALVSGVGAIVSWAFLKYSAISIQPIRKMLFTMTAGAFLISVLLNLIAGIATWGHYFDGLGHTQLHYEITDDNRVRLYANHTISPYTGKQLEEVTPEVVSELDARRRNVFAEVINPTPEQWFAPGTGIPLLWYSEREDGIHVFNMSGFDPSTRDQLQPVTTAIEKQFYRERERHAEMEQREQQKQLKASQALQSEREVPANQPKEKHQGSIFQIVFQPLVHFSLNGSPLGGTSSGGVPTHSNYNPYYPPQPQHQAVWRPFAPSHH